MPVGLPVASSPLATMWRPFAAAVMVIMLLLGVGPGSYFDLAVFSFHEPTAGSVWASATPATARTATTTEVPMRPRASLIRPPLCSYRWGGDGPTIHTSTSHGP